MIIKKDTVLPSLERKQLLDSFLCETNHIAKVQWMHSNGEAYSDVIQQHGLEGIVLKRANSKYQINKRSQDWLKVINYHYTDVFITGFRKDEFGLLLGIEEDNNIKPAGVMEFMNTAERKQFHNLNSHLIIDENNKFVFIEPSIKCKVKFRNYTKAGFLRIPSFVEYIS
ncbi:hypothetical protein [Peribacillus simplex]|uniref:ATP-dependent DNA ligase n=1 Tax=Peribacillus simplex TaxID=1478 RepID=UPI000BA5195B|nr:hypothetical protein [Peribacillus simplex]PAK36734.1 hypothetical protein CHI08_23655 [Peribacillus simplex]